ncbi:cobalamin-dependent protein [Nocardia cyriacigeorgica]|uniref:B12-binding domain-containing radical SAM protein n=1 Tax=Nocardia cyriacigeorgica TaxID=135487 RepID=UPI00189511E4|nr:cobalamin-dependent protein [Nocardia cyriacigeorgica]MBF6397889.1 cobalamin-dependent protein [Nocardia cyriacigeorgica]MBF6402454.1 cobalamin-dependent protein [Nocardia cyriacigeorgica]
MTAASAEHRVRVSLVDLSGETSVRYTPLGAMYLRAALEADPGLNRSVSTTIHSFLAGTSLVAMLEAIIESEPDLIGFSCQGWNISTYRQLIPTLRQLLPQTVVVLGGNHVSQQGERWLCLIPEADIVVNGEGEQTLREIVRWRLTTSPPLPEIAGISYRDGADAVSTADRPRATSFDQIVSPYLEDSQELASADVALWETNRGCPYHCSFCYWGGAVGQKLSRAETDRLRAELTTIAEAGVPAIFLCDANFGILPRDVEVARMVVEAREKYGNPHTLHVNWAKNHASRVEEILGVLRDGGVRTNVYLALQTLNRSALALAGRDERGRPEMFQLARRVIDAGGDIGAELIFGLPGETVHDFESAYDELYLQFQNLLVHPLWILPNTTYDTDRERFGLITLRPDPTVDYEGVLEHKTLTRRDNQQGLALLMADDVLVGTKYARTTIRALAVWNDLRPSQILHGFKDFLANRTDTLAKQLRDAFAHVEQECYFHRHLRSKVRSALFTNRNAAAQLLIEFIDVMVGDPVIREACREVARYDAALLPRADLDHGQPREETLTFSYDVHSMSQSLLRQPAATQIPVENGVAIRIRHPTGFARHSSDAIDLTGQWRGHVVEVLPALPSRSQS